MLVGPLDGQGGPFIVVKTADVVATAVVVLGVKESVCVVPVSPGFVETVV